MTDAAHQRHDNGDAAAAAPALRSFVHAEEFFPRLHGFCENPTEAELDYLKAVLDCYQNDPYLLEPFLEELSKDPISAFKQAFSTDDQREKSDSHATNSAATSAVGFPVHLLAIYLYWLSKVVTAKVMIRYFPHSVADFSFLHSLVTSPAFHSYPWEARYILLLWLTLVINIPFSLDKFGNSIYDSLEETAMKRWLRSTGKERDAVALFGSKYFNRKDISEERLLSFLGWCQTALIQEQEDAFLLVGIFQFLNALLLDTTRQNLTPHIRNALYGIATLPQSEELTDAKPRLQSPLLRRLRAKFAGRLATTYLAPRPSSVNGGTSAILMGPAGAAAENRTEDLQVPEEVEMLLSGLMESLTDADSRVRWTASKAISKIAASVPSVFMDEIQQLVVSLYEDNILNHGTKEEDLSLVSAAAWHGATLCLASILRQNLLSAGQIRHIYPWIDRALTFSQRKGAQKVGSNVRDAACYFCWCLARATSIQGELMSDGQKEQMSTTLVMVACLDEEHLVRRAASAAFQECAGRMTGIHEGLDVLQLIDAQIVGSRRSAYLEATCNVAKRYPFYSTPLLERLHQVLLYHQEISIRELSAESIKRILLDSPGKVGKAISDEIVKLKTVKESKAAHGSLLLLVTLCSICKSSESKAEAFMSLALLPQSLCSGASIALLLPVIGKLAQVCLIQDPPADTRSEGFDPKNTWRRFFDAAQRRPEAASHKAAGALINATLKSGTSPTSQQAVTAVLGCFDYSPSSSCNQLLNITVDRLLKVLQPGTIDARCNCLNSIARIYLKYSDDPKTDRDGILAALFKGLDEYITDERGEVGSLIRNICLEQITSIVLLQHNRHELLPATLDKLIVQLLKQSVETFDVVRDLAGRQLRRLSGIKQVVSERELQDWHYLTTALRAVCVRLPYLEHQSRLLVLSGIVTSVGSPPEIKQPAAAIMLEWVKTLESRDQEVPYDVTKLLQDLLEIAVDPTKSNRVIVPALNYIAALLEEHDVVTDVQESLLASIRSASSGIQLKSSVKPKKAAAQRLLAAVSVRRLNG